MSVTELLQAVQYVVDNEGNKNAAMLDKEYARLVSRHVDGLQENPRPSGVKRLFGLSRRRNP